MRDNREYDRILKQALSSDEQPDELLNKRVLELLAVKEKETMGQTSKKHFRTIGLVAALVLLMSVSVFAAWNLLSAKQVAEEFGYPALAKAFESKDAIRIGEQKTDGGYKFTLHGIVSGLGLDDFAPEIDKEKTYAVISIEKEDGSPMPEVSSDEYGKVPFFISPLIRGEKPWQVNAASMGGGYNEMVKDGITYRLLECDSIEMFADRGIDLCMISNSSFYTIEAYDYDETTGRVTPKPEYEGANVLFTLPIDPSKADREKADQYLKELWGPGGPEPEPSGDDQRFAPSGRDSAEPPALTVKSETDGDTQTLVITPE